MGKSVSDYMKIAWNVFGKKVVRKGIYGAYDTMVRDR